MRTCIMSRAAFVLVFLLGASAAFAQQDYEYIATKGMDESFRLDLGGFFQSFDTVVSVGSSAGGDGSIIDLEKEFNLGNQTTFRLDGRWRFGRHGSLLFGYRGWSRSADKTLEKEIDFGDQTFQVGAEVELRQRVHIADLYYAYSFVNTGRFETGLMLGFTGLFNKLSLDASVTGPGGGATATRQQDNLTIPMPSFGAYVGVTILPRLFIEASVRGFPTITVNNYSGNHIDVRAGAVFFFTKNFGLGVKYQYADLEVSRSNAPRVTLDYRYNGPVAFLTAAF